MATDPPRTPSLEELGALVQHLAQSVAVIHQRLEQLERRASGSMPGPTQGAAPPAFVAAPPPAFVAAPPPAFVAAPPPDAGILPSRAWWQVGALASVTPDKAPIVALAAAGGLAVLVGMLFFVWYAVDRGWLSPTTRLLLGGGAGLAMMIAAWPLATRNPSAAGGLGGAGLGTWFGVWLVARHVHGVVGPTETFVGLGLAAAACLAMAGLRRLRLMAVLGALAAFATPIATATGADRLHELMAYQLLVMAGLVALEHVRRWLELGHMAVVGTWLLMAGWAEQHLRPASSDAMLGWTLALLAVTSAQTVLLRLRGLPAAHAAGRHLAGGLMAWSAVVASVWDRTELFAWVTLGMAAWHLGLLAWSRSRGPCNGLHAVLLGLGWAQLLAFGPLRMHGNALPAWWLGQGIVGGLTVVLQRGWLPLRLAAAPLLAVLAWVLQGDRSDAGLAFGLAVAGVLVVVALLPGGPALRADGAPPRADGAPVPDEGGPMVLAALVLAGLVAGLVAELHLPLERTAWAPLLVLAPAAAATLRTLVGLDPSRARGAAVGLALALAWAVGHVGADDLLQRVAAGPERSAVAVAAALVGAAGLALIVILRRRAPTIAGIAETHDMAGVLVALGFALALEMVVASWLYAAAPGDPGRWSMVLASTSVLGALAALAGIVAGLGLQREAWRKLALGGLVVVAAKVVLVDLEEVDIAYRVLSFVGLGACMLLGAIAYGRALRRLEPPAGPGPGPG